MRGRAGQIARRVGRAGATVTVALGLLGAPAAHAAAAAGSLDTSFGGGVVSTPGSRLLGVAVAPSGEVIAVGQRGGSVVAVRFSAAGGLEDQYVGPAGAARGVVLQPDGKVVLAGTSQGSLLVERLNANLTPDSSFGTNGQAAAFVGTGAVANAVALAPDGRIVAAGSLNPPDTRVAVARFTSDGRADLAVSPGFDHYSAANGVAVQSDGKIVLVGQQTPLQVTNAVVARLNPNGSADPTFRNAGGAFTYSAPNTGYTSLTAVRLQVDGKIVASGVDVAGPNAIFVRVDANGALDTSFGSGGVASLPAAQNLSSNPGNAIGAYGVGVAGGGRIVGSGMFEDTGVTVDAADWAFTAAGAPQGGFGSGGTVTGPNGTYEACALAVAPDGSLVSVGDTVTSFPDSNPCAVNGSANGFAVRYIGFGPAPTSPPPPPAGGSPPSVFTGGASSVTETAAHVAGQVNPHGSSTQFYFQYGRTASYGFSSASASGGSAGAAGGVASTLRGLRTGTTYHYRLVATNGVGTATGADATFKTLPRLRFGVRRLKRSYHQADALDKGISLRFSCSQPCAAVASVSLSGKVANQLGLGSKAVTIARGSARLRRPGSGSLLLTFRAKFTGALRQALPISLPLSLKATPSSGGPAIRVSRTLKLER